MRQLKRFGKAAQTLQNELDTIFNNANGIWVFLDEAYLINELENVDDILIGEYEGSSYGEYEFEVLRNGASLLMEMITEAKDLIPKTQKGNPKNMMPLKRSSPACCHLRR